MSVPIEQAFTPAHEIDDPERFAGRATILNDLAGALGLEGGHIVIFGNRHDRHRDERTLAAAASSRGRCPSIEWKGRCRSTREEH